MEYIYKASQFAEAIVIGQYDDAYSMLCDNLKASLHKDNLKTEYEEMVDYLKPPIKVDGHTETIEEWPDKLVNDIGWAYVSISGQDGCEAITVIVCKEGGEFKGQRC